MAARVRWSATAADDLEAIADYISRDSERYAAAVLQRVRAAAQELILFPLRGRFVPEFNDPDVRECIVGNYRLIYLHYEHQVTVLAVIHGARDLLTVWEAETRTTEPGLPSAGED